MYDTESETEAFDKDFTRVAHERREILTKKTLNAAETAYRKLLRVLRDSTDDGEEK